MTGNNWNTRKKRELSPQLGCLLPSEAQRPWPHLLKLEHIFFFNAKAEVTRAQLWWSGSWHKHTAARRQD